MKLFNYLLSGSTTTSALKHRTQATRQVVTNFARWISGRPVVISPLHADTIKQLGSTIVHKPIIGNNTEAIIAALKEEKSNILVFGAHILGKTILETLKDGIGIRRGTQLQVDEKAAIEYNVMIDNTPGVNAPFVAKYMDDVVDLPAGKKGHVAVIGVGNVGLDFAERAIANGHHAALFSRGLSNPETQAEQFAITGLPLDKTRCATSIADAMNGATHVGISIPISDQTRGIIKASDIDGIASGAKVVIISPIGVISPEAVKRLYERNDLSVTFDNTKPEMDEIKTLIGTPLRAGFRTQSNAMNAPECQIAMDGAVKLKLASAMLRMKTADNNPDTSPVISREKQNDPMIVVGAGIAGSMIALKLTEIGYKNITIYDSFNPNDPHSISATLGDGKAMRHASASESTAAKRNRGDGKILKLIEEGGLALHLPQSNATQTWAKGFDKNAKNIASTNNNNELVIELNRSGVKSWCEMQKKYPELFAGIYHHDRITRIYVDQETFAVGKELQMSINNSCKILSDEERAKHPLASKPNVVGALEINGLGVDVTKFMKNLHAKLADNGVRIVHGDVEAVKQQPSGNVTITLKSGEKTTASKVYLATGASTKLFEGTNLENALQNIAGVFVSFNNLDNPIAAPTKIHAKDPAAVVNILPAGQDEHGNTRILVSGGFAFAPHSNPETYANDKERLYAIMEEAILKPFFPKSLASGQKIRVELCFRPTTETTVPIVGKVTNAEQPDEQKSNIIFSGGNHAAGFTHSIETTIQAVNIGEDRESIITKTLGVRKSSINPTVIEATRQANNAQPAR